MYKYKRNVNTNKNKTRNFFENKNGLYVQVRNGDLEQALRVLKKKVKRSGLVQECKSREFYTKPSEQRRIAKRKGVKRWKKYLAKREKIYGY